MSQENLRAADADRDRVVEELREHTAAGRLTMDEFEERMQAAMSARTFGDLAKLTTDLPVLATRAPHDGLVDLAALPQPPVRRGLPRPVLVWMSISAFLIVVWAVTSTVGGGHANGFWPIAPIIIGGLIMRRVMWSGRYRGPSYADRHARHLEMRQAQTAARRAQWEERMARRAERWGRRWDDRD